MRSAPNVFASVAGILLALAAAVCGDAQAPAGPLPPRPGVKPQPAEQKPRERAQIRVKVELVTTPVTVRDKSGEMVLDLGKDDFRVYDNGVEQRIENFDLGGDPISAVAVIETSSRIEPLLPAVRRSGIVFTETVMAQSGEAAVLTYDDLSTTSLAFTSDHEAVERAFSSIRVGTSGAKLYDTLSQGVDMLRNRPASRRRVLVVFAEAADTGSETKLGEVLRAAQLENVTIYTVGLSTTLAMLRAEPKQSGPPPISPPGTFPRPPIPGTVQTPTTEQQRGGNINLLAVVAWIVERLVNAVGENSLELATAATGGQHHATKSDRSIEQAVADIGGELHAQYSLSYHPVGTRRSAESPAESFGYHDIKVAISRPGLTVRARPGYYLAPPEAQ